MQIGVDWRNDWNNNIDASDVALEFLTTSASGVIVFARGTISGDFLQIRLMGRTRARATMNLGLYELKFLLFCWPLTKNFDEIVDLDVRAKSKSSVSQFSDRYVSSYKVTRLCRLLFSKNSSGRQEKVYMFGGLWNKKYVADIQK